MKPLVVATPGEETRAEDVAHRIDAEVAATTVRSFPDGETYVRFHTPVEGRQVIVVASLDQPDTTFMPLFLVAETARDLGASTVGAVTPYLPYLRQDDRFKEGEGITSRYFGRLMSSCFDWLVTVDPHLHRLNGLSEIYGIPVEIVSAAGAIADWIDDELADPILVGPDEESRQWVAPVAERGDFPSLVLEKVRHGDYDVQIQECDETVTTDRKPVLIDDIISTGRTMIEAVDRLAQLGMQPPVCVGIHGLFAGDALEALEGAGIDEVITCNSVDHRTNAIDITDPLVTGIVRALEPGASVAVASRPGAG